MVSPTFQASIPHFQSLTLITSALGCPSTWLILRFLHPVLLIPNSISVRAPGTGLEHPEILSDGKEDDEDRIDGLVLVSLLRDANFWLEGARGVGRGGKGVGLFSTSSCRIRVQGWVLSS